MVTGEGDFLIVGLRFAGGWCVWGGLCGGWGTLGEEQRFRTYEEADDMRKYALASAEKQKELLLEWRVFVAETTSASSVVRVYLKNGEMSVDLKSKCLTAHERRQLGWSVADEAWRG